MAILNNLSAAYALLWMFYSAPGVANVLRSASSRAAAVEHAVDALVDTALHGSTWDRALAPVLFLMGLSVEATGMVLGLIWTHTAAQLACMYVLFAVWLAGSTGGVRVARLVCAGGDELPPDELRAELLRLCLPSLVNDLGVVACLGAAVLLAVNTVF